MFLKTPVVHIYHTAFWKFAVSFENAITRNVMPSVPYYSNCIVGGLLFAANYSQRWNYFVCDFRAVSLYILVVKWRAKKPLKQIPSNLGVSVVLGTIFAGNEGIERGRWGDHQSAICIQVVPHFDAHISLWEPISTAKTTSVPVIRAKIESSRELLSQ